MDDYTLVKDEDPKILYSFINWRNTAVAWECYRGSLISSRSAQKPGIFYPLSFWALSLMTSNDHAKILREYNLEVVRQSHYPNKASRLSSLFCAKDHKSATRISKNWGDNNNHFNLEFLVELGVDPLDELTVVDSNWYTFKEKYTHSNTDWMKRYWNGDECPDTVDGAPLWEVLVQSRILIYGTELRTKSKEYLDRLYPECSCLLELSRIACLIGSDFGHIVPFIHKIDENTAECKFLMNFEDAKNTEFHTKLKKYVDDNSLSGTVDMNALNMDTIRLPDLRPFRQFNIKNNLFLLLLSRQS